MKFFYYLWLTLTVLWGLITLLVFEAFTVVIFLIFLANLIFIRYKLGDRLKPLFRKKVDTSSSVSNYSETSNSNATIRSSDAVSNIKGPIPNKFPEPDIEFRVAGISKTNENGQRVQTLLSDYVKDSFDDWNPPYMGVKNKEMIEDFMDEVYYFEPIDWYDAIKFVPEPDNKYSKNAIKIYHDEIGHIGYVPEDDTLDVKDFMDKNKFFKTESVLMGGPKKVVDGDTVVVEKGLYVVGVRLFG